MDLYRNFSSSRPDIPGSSFTYPKVDCPPETKPLKSETYECGIETFGETRVQIKAQYYIFALVFLIFDIEVVFLYPWAVAFDNLPMFAVLEGVLFIMILVAGLFYTWRKGVLEWV